MGNLSLAGSEEAFQRAAMQRRLTRTLLLSKILSKNHWKSHAATTANEFAGFIQPTDQKFLILPYNASYRLIQWKTAFTSTHLKHSKRGENLTNAEILKSKCKFVRQKRYPPSLA